MQTTSSNINNPEEGRPEDNAEVKGIRLFGKTEEIDGIQVTEERAGTCILSMKGIFSEEDCQKIINFYKNNPQLVHDGQTLAGNLPAKKCKEASISGMLTPEAKQLDDEVYQKIKKIFNVVAKIFPAYLLGNCADSMYLIQHYDTKEDFYHWHVDVAPKRRLALIVYLNDVEEGGETEFWYQDIKVKPEVGKVLIFPTDGGYTHRGCRPVSGEKFILTTFLVDN